MLTLTYYFGICALTLLVLLFGIPLLITFYAWLDHKEFDNLDKEFEETLRRD